MLIWVQDEGGCLKNYHWFFGKQKEQDIHWLGINASVTDQIEPIICDYNIDTRITNSSFDSQM